MSIWWSLHLRREAASVPLARRFLLGTMETAGVDPEISFDLSVALTEACANAVEHGGDHRPREDRPPYERWEREQHAPGEEEDEREERGERREERRGERVPRRGPRDPRDERPGEAPGQYRVTAYLDGEKCRIEVTDSGPGFPSRRAPRSSGQQYGGRPYPSLSAEDGRGLCLIEQLADHVHFGNRPGRGAVVSFDKVLKWREGALLMVS
ncbi:ATP-binding protein [Streptomyces sp. NPDC014744]|uniref:ATP-binding protein n=1 Tax=Streptomyces sp. NPDC014744 TaxID=3364903 RepID=UPI003702411C